MLNTDAIDKLFPYESYRSGQKEAILEILQSFASGKKFFILEAPTGSGKSAIGITLAKLMGSAYYITSTKQLQNQILGEFPDIVDLQGRNSYHCTYWETLITLNAKYPGKYEEDIRRSYEDKTVGRTAHDQYLSCDRGPCKIQGRPTCDICVPYKHADWDDKDLKCLYWKQLRKAQSSDITLFNFKSFLYNILLKRFEKRPLIIIDEAHNTEDQLLDLIQFTISDKLLSKIDFPELESVESYIRYFENIKLEDKLRQEACTTLAAGDPKSLWKFSELESTIAKYAMFSVSATNDQWVFEYEDKGYYRNIIFKPLYVRQFAHKYLFEHTQNVLMMSATILSPTTLCDSLGISSNSCAAYRMKNRFNVENRRIYYKPTGSMAYSKKLDTLPSMVKSIDQICDQYKNKKGIIHTHSFDIADYILENSSSAVQNRLLYQKHWRTKEEMLEEHTKRSDTIILAPAMHEGIDLKDDLSRFSIICKVPYPSFHNNKRLEARMRISRDYYTWLTATKLVQSTGRSVRSEDDYADTYVLDTDFAPFCKTASTILPSWFTDAIVW